MATEPLLTLDDLALEQVFEAACNLASMDQLYLRVGVRGGGCSGFEYDLDLVKGKPGPRDIVWEQDMGFYDSPHVLIAVDPISAQYLRGTVVQYVSDGLLSGFKFKNPLAKSTCGCGKSFSA